MKRIIGLSILAVMAASCLSSAYSEYSLTSVSNFDYSGILSDIGADSLYLEGAFAGGSGSSSLVFLSARSAEGEPLTGGFALTMKRDSSLVIKEDNAYPQYTIFEKSAVYGSQACAVFYQNDVEALMPEHDVVFTNAGYGTCTPSRCAVNNTQLGVYSILEDPQLKFTEGDWLRLVATGYLNGSPTGTSEFYLADFRTPERGGAAPDSVTVTWKTMSLSALGNVEYIDFTIETNKAGFPKYCCIDNLVSAIYVRQ